MKVKDRVVHNSRPELGVGTITAINDDRVNVEFQGGKFSGITLSSIKKFDPSVSRPSSNMSLQKRKDEPSRVQLDDSAPDNKSSDGAVFLVRWFLLAFPIFFVVLIFNQSSYGSCFESYCIAAALPRVLVITFIVSGVFAASM